MTGCKLLYSRHTVCHLAADSIKIRECGGRGDMLLDVTDYLVESAQRLRRLAVKADVTREIKLAYLVGAFDDNGIPLGLSYKPQHLGMSVFTEDYNLLLVIGVSKIFLLDAFLQMQYNRARGINYPDIVLFSNTVCGWRLAMSTQQYLRVLQPVKLLMPYGFQPQALETVTFLSVMDNVTQAIKPVAAAQFLLRLPYGTGYSEAEPLPLSISITIPAAQVL